MGAQLALYEGWKPGARPHARRRPAPQPPLCAGCRAREARYGFKDESEDPMIDRPRTRPRLDRSRRPTSPSLLFAAEQHAHRRR